SEGTVVRHLGTSSIGCVGRTRSPTGGIPLCCGWYPSTGAASRLRARVLFETGRLCEYAWEPVETETPASSATSLNVGRFMHRASVSMSRDRFILGFALLI